MDATQLRQRTKRAVSRWCGLPVADITLMDLLGDLRGGSREPLRQRVNQEFAGEPGIPVSAVIWQGKAAKTVADIRDLVKERSGS